MVPTRFAVAAHILLMIASDPGELRTSQRLATSINTNPVVVRRIMASMARAGLVRVRRGPGGAALMHPPEAITLQHVWRAVHSETRPLLPIHANPDPCCIIGRRVQAVLGEAFQAAENALEEALGQTTLADLLQGVRLEEPVLPPCDAQAIEEPALAATTHLAGGVPAG